MFELCRVQSAIREMQAYLSRQFKEKQGWPLHPIAITIYAIAVSLSLAVRYPSEQNGGFWGTLGLIGDAVGGILTLTLVIVAHKELSDTRRAMDDQSVVFKSQKEAFDNLSRFVDGYIRNAYLSDTPVLVIRTIPGIDGSYDPTDYDSLEHSLMEGISPRELVHFTIYSQEDLVLSEIDLVLDGLRADIYYGEDPCDFSTKVAAQRFGPWSSIRGTCLLSASSDKFCISVYGSTKFRRYRFDFPLHRESIYDYEASQTGIAVALAAGASG